MFTRVFRDICALVVAFVLAGCANLSSSQFRAFDVGNNQSVAIDARQRVVISSARASDISGRSSDSANIRTVCSEPSPDALSVFGAQFSADIRRSEEVLARLAANYAESGSNIGIRTQTIQLLRDSMYRLCEGYQNGALGPAEFARLHRAYQNSMLALLAVEQLTGVVTGPSVALSTASSLQLTRIQDDLDAQRDYLSELQEDHAVMETLQSETNVVEAQVASTEPIDEIETKIEDAEENIAFLERMRGEILSGDYAAIIDVGNSSSSGSDDLALDAESIAIVARAVKDIVQAVIDVDYTIHECFELFRGYSDKGELNETDYRVVNLCMDEIKAYRSPEQVSSVSQTESTEVDPDAIVFSPQERPESFVLNMPIPNNLAAGDRAWYYFDAVVAGFYEVSTFTPIDSDADPYLYVLGPLPQTFNPDTFGNSTIRIQLIAENDDGYGYPDATITFYAEQGRSYVVGIDNIGLQGNSEVEIYSSLSR